MNELTRKSIYAVFSLINLFTPKKNRVFIYGGNELSGNSEAMLRYLSDNSSVPIVCIAEKRAGNFTSSEQVVFKKNTLWNAFWACTCSKVVLESSLHTIKMKPTSKQLFIQMWHGSPLKHLSRTKQLKNGDYYSCILYASDLFKDEMRQSFVVDDNKLVLVGNPRNDDLLKETRLPRDFENNGKIILWLPTFRRGIGLKETEKDLPILDNNNILELDERLVSLGIKLYIKPHPLQMGGLSELFSSYKPRNFQLITDDILREHNLTLYSFLGKTDALLTDYSSVFFDYLLLNKPIGFAIDDIDEYKKSRGFSLEPAENYMPGKKILTMHDLLQFVQDVHDGNDEYEAERKAVNNKVNYYTDDKSCERCAKLILNTLGIEDE